MSTELVPYGISYGMGRQGSDEATNQALMQELTGEPAKLRERLAASCEVARGLEGVDPSRVGCIGANDPDFGAVYDADADRRSGAAMRRFFAETLD